MCGRLNITNDKNIHDVLDLMGVNFGDYPVRYNLAPTDQIPVVHYWEGQRLISDMRWWLVPNWSSGPSTKFSMFNARSERLLESRAYQGSFRYKRCVVPAQSFIEWRRSTENKTPYCFSRPGGSLRLAGLWDYWTDGSEHILSCSIVTTAASFEFEKYHKRMPVLLGADTAEHWLDEKTQPEDLHHLFNSTLAHPLQAVAIDDQINNSRNKEAPMMLEDPLILK